MKQHESNILNISVPIGSRSVLDLENKPGNMLKQAVLNVGNERSFPGESAGDFPAFQLSSAIFRINIEKAAALVKLESI